jgi:hypothetical protein
VAKKKRKRKVGASASTSTSTSTKAETAADEPVFFFGFTVPRAKLAFARFWFFGLLAADAFLQLRHAPRYGAGGFNVSHLPFTDAAPGRVAVGAAYLLLASLFGAIALGVGSRVTVAIAAAIYGWVYFSSQLDSYQHHYLMVLVLIVAVGVPWFRPRDARRADGAEPVKTWAVRLILLQLAIVYLWAAISKMDGRWLDGTTLRGAVSDGRVHDLIDRVTGFRGGSIAVLITELVLAATIWQRRLWPIALPLGVGMHVGIAFTDLEIGLFSWLMVALYVLIVPDRVFLALWRRLSPAPFLDRVAARVDRPIVATLALTLAVVVAIVLAIEIPRAIAMALIGAAIVIGADTLRLRRRFPRLTAPAAGGAVSILLAVLAAKTTVVPDYYRLWGGASRRLGDPDAARFAYSRATEVAPDLPGNHYQLARLLLADGDAHDETRGLAELRRAQLLEPTRARAFVEEALYLARVGRREEALAAARAAATAEPTSATATRLVAALEKNTAPPPPAAPGDDEDAP